MQRSNKNKTESLIKQTGEEAEEQFENKAFLGVRKALFQA